MVYQYRGKTGSTDYCVEYSFVGLPVPGMVIISALFNYCCCELRYYTQVLYQ